MLPALAAAGAQCGPASSVLPAPRAARAECCQRQAESGLPDLRPSTDGRPVMGVDLLLLWRQQLATHEMILGLAPSRACRISDLPPLRVVRPVRERMEVKLVLGGLALGGDGAQVFLRPRGGAHQRRRGSRELARRLSARVSFAGCLSWVRHNPPDRH